MICLKLIGHPIASRLLRDLETKIVSFKRVKVIRNKSAKCIWDRG